MGPLYPDIVDLIIASVDFNSLQQCSLVSKIWLASSRVRLFSAIKLEPLSFPSFKALVAGADNFFMVSYIRRVILEGFSIRRRDDEIGNVLVFLANSFPRINELHLRASPNQSYYPTDLSTGPSVLPFSSLPIAATFWDNLEALCVDIGFPHLDDFLGLITKCRALKHLQVRNIGMKSSLFAVSSTPSCNLSKALRKFSWNCHGISRILEPLLSQAPFHLDELVIESLHAGTLLDGRNLLDAAGLGLRRLRLDFWVHKNAFRGIGTIEQHIGLSRFTHLQELFLGVGDNDNGEDILLNILSQVALFASLARIGVAFAASIYGIGIHPQRLSDIFQPPNFPGLKVIQLDHSDPLRYLQIVTPLISSSSRFRIVHQ